MADLSHKLAFQHHLQYHRRMAKSDENRVRRMASRQGLILNKSRRRDPLAFDFEAFWILDESGYIVVGDERYGMTLQEAETWLRHPQVPSPKRRSSVAVAAKPQKSKKK